MIKENTNFYKKFTKNLFSGLLLLIIVKVFINNGLISSIIPALNGYEDLLSFIIVVLVYLGYVLGGLLTFKKETHKYLYVLLFNILFYIGYYFLGTDGFVKSFNYAEQLKGYSWFTSLFTLTTSLCILGIFKGNFTNKTLDK